MALERGGPHDVPADDEVAKRGREALDLGLDAFGHVLLRPVRDVAVRPGGLSAARIEAPGLREQDERMLGGAALPRVSLGRRDLGQRAAEVNGSGARRVWCPPGN